MNKKTKENFTHTKYMNKIKIDESFIKKNANIVKSNNKGTNKTKIYLFMISLMVVFLIIGVLGGIKAANYCQYQWQSSENYFLHQQYIWQQQEIDLQTKKTNIEKIKKQLQQETERLLEQKNQSLPKESLLNNIWDAITGRDEKKRQQRQEADREINKRLLQMQENIKNLDIKIDDLNKAQNKLRKLKSEIEKKYQENSTLIGYLKQIFL